MIGTLEWVTGAIAMVGAVCRMWLWRGSLPRPGARRIAAFALCIGLSMTMLRLVAVPVPDAWLPLHHALPVLAAEFKLAAECFLALTALELRSGDGHRSQARCQIAGSVLVMAATGVLYRVAGVSLVGSVLTVESSGRAALAAYNALFTVHSMWCVSLFTMVIHRSARHLGRGLLRTGLRLIVAAGGAGLVWSALSVIPLVTGLRTGRQVTGEDAHSAPFAVATLALGIGGATLTAWGDRLAAPVRRLRARRSHRRIGPLWTALHGLRPEIALHPPTKRIGLGGPGNAEFALYRRVIEIRDGQLALRTHLHPEVPGWAAAACGDRLDGERRAATVEAAVIAAALEAAAVGHRYPGSSYVPPTVPADLDTETAWLILVAEAFTGSPVVAEIRRRVRVELGPPDSPTVRQLAG